MRVVDVHCHTFNADDLPVEGFIAHVVGHDRVALVRALAWALAEVTQGMASGREEIETLDRLIAAGPGFVAADEKPTVGHVDAEADNLLAQLRTEDPALFAAAVREAAQDGPVGGEENLVDPAAELQRYLRWVALFGRDRLTLTRMLLGLYPQVELYTPMLVDLQGLGTTPCTSPVEQLQLQERISRLGILNYFEGRQVLPFVGFDPRWPEALAVVRQAVESSGFIGVKLYPTMGFLPLGNADAQPEQMSRELGAQVDEQLRSLYDWCSANDVPVTAHVNPTNYAQDAYRDNSAPQHWAPVLQGWPDLHLNLGHLGWEGEHWPDEIAELMSHHQGLYADIGNHDLAVLPDTIERLARLFADPQTARLQDRLMFGTDWFMVASHHDFESFLTTVQAAYAVRFPESVDRFMGGAALSFLGFDDPGNANTRRVRTRFASLAMAQPPWLT